jgi:hypothetical protein
MGLGSLVTLAATPTYSRGSNLRSTPKFPFHRSGGFIIQPGGVQQNLHALVQHQFAVIRTEFPI